MKNTRKADSDRKTFFDRKNLTVLGIAASVVIVFAVVMTKLVPTDVNQSDRSAFDSEAWKSSVREVEQSYADSGLTAVYNQDKSKATEDGTDSDTDNKTLSDENKTAENGEETTNRTVNITFSAPVNGEILKDYSGEELVYSETMRDWRCHGGVDFAADEGNEVVCVADGTVEAISDDGMYGRCVVVIHNGGLRSIYSNLADGSEVSVGDNVLQGGIIGKVGSTAVAEATEGSHLHFEVSLNGETVDPHNYLDTNS